MIEDIENPTHFTPLISTNDIQPTYRRAFTDADVYRKETCNPTKEHTASIATMRKTVTKLYLEVRPPLVHLSFIALVVCMGSLLGTWLGYRLGEFFSWCFGIVIDVSVNYAKKAQKR